MIWRAGLVFSLFYVLAAGQTGIYRLSDVHAGQHAKGRTVFQGNRIDEFDVEILGILDNAGPKQSLILAKLSGGPIADTGVAQGMSGSPVYLNGKLLGAVAIAFPFSKDPIAGIRPIEEMLSSSAQRQLPTTARISLDSSNLDAILPPSQATTTAGWTVQNIATPLSFGNMSARTIDTFAPQLRRLGMEPRQGISGQGTPKAPMPASPHLEPGSMISVQLVSGDMSMGADGTVTYVDANRVLAFGHQFMALGDTELPFARASVITTLANLNTSFKISTAQEWLGTITQDRSVAIAGELGRKASLVPVTIDVGGYGASHYQVSIVRDRALTPFLLQMVIFAALDATQRTAGASTINVSGSVTFRDGTPPLLLDNIYAGEANTALQAALGITLPVAYTLQSQFESLQIDKISVQLQVSNRVKELQVDQLYCSRRDLHAGETVEIAAVLTGDDGNEVTRRTFYKIPPGLPPGPLYFTLGDAATINLLEYAQLAAFVPKNPKQLVDLVNSLRSNTNAYLRVWRAEQSFQLNGQEITSPPASLSILLGRAQSRLATNAQAKIAEIPLPFYQQVTGSKTIQIDVKD